MCASVYEHKAKKMDRRWIWTPHPTKFRKSAALLKSKWLTTCSIIFSYFLSFFSTLPHVTSCFLLVLPHVSDVSALYLHIWHIRHIPLSISRSPAHRWMGADTLGVQTTAHANGYLQELFGSTHLTDSRSTIGRAVACIYSHEQHKQEGQEAVVFVETLRSVHRGQAQRAASPFCWWSPQKSFAFGPSDRSLSNTSASSVRSSPASLLLSVLPRLLLQIEDMLGHNAELII